MEHTAPATLVTPAGTILFNQTGVANYLWTSDVQGLSGMDLRTSMDDKPHDHGALIHTFLKKARQITVTGLVVYATASSRNTTCKGLSDALESIATDTDGTYSWTWTGMPTMSLTVRCDQLIPGFTGSGMSPRGFVFGLVAGDPTIR